MFSLHLSDGLWVSCEYYVALRPGRQRRGLFQAEFEESLARDADLLALLYLLFSDFIWFYLLLLLS